MKVIIPAAGLGTRVENISKGLPKTLIPINGRPALHYIISEIKEIIGNDLEEIEIIVGEEGKQSIPQFCNENFKEIQFSFTEQKERKGLAHALSLSSAKEKQRTCIWLGDTIIKNKEPNMFFTEYKTKEILTDPSGNYILAKPHKTNDYDRWCNVYPLNDEKFKFYEKVEPIKDQNAAWDTGFLIGIYVFEDGKKILDFCREICKIDQEGEYQISQAIELYRKEHPVYAVNFTADYFDIGSIDNFHKTKRLLFSAREHHSLEVTNFNVIKKSGREDINHQVRWYKDLPPSLKHYAPTVYETRGWENSYTMEYIPATTLQELMIWHRLHPTVWDDIFSKIIRLLVDFSTSYRNINDGNLGEEKEFSEFFFNKMLREKTKSRALSPAYQRPEFKDLLSAITVMCSDSVLSRVKELNMNFNSIMHGDLCFSNILYDVNTGILKVIDPRGYIEDNYSTIFGSSLYDLAKLFHSFYYDYDLIKNNIKERSEYHETIKSIGEKKTSRVFFINENPEQVERILLAVKIINFHLFASMIPLHGDKPEHQIRMKDQAMSIYNSICSELI